MRGEIARLAGLTSLLPEEERGPWLPEHEEEEDELASVRELPLR